MHPRVKGWFWPVKPAALWSHLVTEQPRWLLWLYVPAYSPAHSLTHTCMHAAKMYNVPTWAGHWLNVRGQEQSGETGNVLGEQTNQWLKIQWGENGMRKFEENRKTPQKDRARRIENDKKRAAFWRAPGLWLKKKIKNSISHLKEAGLYSLRFHWHTLYRCKVSCKTFRAVCWLAHSCNRADCASIDYSLRDFCLKPRMILTFLNGFYIKIKGAVLYKRKPTGRKWRQMIL